MGASSKLTILLLLVFLLATGTILGEAKICEYKSQKFRGICIRSSSCNRVCQTEGFPGGQCRGLRRRCICDRRCPEDHRPIN